MITAVDASVLLDVFTDDPRFGAPSNDSLQVCVAEGILIACSVVWAEIAGCFPSGPAAQAAMSRLGVGFSAIEMAAALAAGEAWKMYRSQGGQRDRMVADFLIGAHALAQADRLLTRDRGVYRKYFRGLRVVDPTESRM